jgi:hypothetical protein
VKDVSELKMFLTGSSATCRHLFGEEERERERERERETVENPLGQLSLLVFEVGTSPNGDNAFIKLNSSCGVPGRLLLPVKSVLPERS